MKVLLGNLVYGICAIVALLFMAGAAVVMLAALGEDPVMAAGFASAIALLSYGFGWSSRRMLAGRH